MSLATERGRAGEEAAARYLEAAGLVVLARNWRQGSLELDLVCREGNTLVFVEVRTRARNGLVSPAESLTQAKRRSLLKAVRAYLAAHDAWEQPCRVDLICVTAEEGARPHAPHLEHLCHVLDFSETLGRCNAAWQPW